jgi:hypothetical protein
VPAAGFNTFKPFKTFKSRASPQPKIGLSRAKSAKDAKKKQNNGGGGRAFANLARLARGNVLKSFCQPI